MRFEKFDFSRAKIFDEKKTEKYFVTKNQLQLKISRTYPNMRFQLHRSAENGLFKVGQKMFFLQKCHRSIICSQPREDIHVQGESYDCYIHDTKLQH